MKFWLKPAGSLMALVVATTAMAVLGGCYTVMKHPQTDVTHSDFAHQDCYDCHRADGPAHAYDPLAAPGFSYYDDALFGYYAYPWWHRNYWYSDDYGYGGGGGGFRDSLGFRVPTDDGARRYLWGRGGEAAPPLMPPVYGGVGGGGGGNASPGGGTDPTSTPPPVQDGRTMKPETGPSTTTPPPPPAPPAPPATPPAKNDKKKDDKTNVWGRGGGKG